MQILSIMEKTYEKLKSEYEQLAKRLSDREEEYAKSGVEFEEMVEKTKTIRLKMNDISREMRLIQDPEIEFGKEWKGDLMTLEEFIDNCNNGLLIDYDGFGYYATETGKSDIMIYPSDIAMDKYRKDFSHVIWFNR